MDIILFGMQGSGKGTQGKILAERYGLRIFEMGGALREMIASGSELGNKIKSTVDAGQLVSDEIIMEVVENFLTNSAGKDNLLFDGIPRTIRQSAQLLEHLKNHGRDAFALYIKISEEVAIERLTKRRMCSQCKTIYPAFYEREACGECGGNLVTRTDDMNLDSIKNRIHSFETETIPVIEDFYRRDRLIDVDGEQSITDVTEEMIDKAGYLFN